MSYIQPNSKVILIWGCPCTKDYRHTLKFTSLRNQIEYFTGDIKCGDLTYDSSTDTSNFSESISKIRFDNLNYVRVNQNTIRLKVLGKDDNPLFYNAEKLMTCNYMAFQNTSFGNKWFYAFIDDVIYLNNGTVEVQYTLDVLQTWWFDIKFGECYIERETPIADAVEEMLVPENIPVGDIINYEYKEIINRDYFSPAETISGVGVFNYPLGQSTNSNEIVSGIPRIITTDSWVDDIFDNYRKDGAIRFDSVINICCMPQLEDDGRTPISYEFAKGFGGGKMPATSFVMTIPNITDYQYEIVVDGQERFVWYESTLIRRYDGKILGVGRPMSPKAATFIWFNQVINKLISWGCTILDCWVEPDFSFYAKNSDKLVEKSVNTLRFDNNFILDNMYGAQGLSLYHPINKKLYTHPYQYFSIINNNNAEKQYKPQLFASFNNTGVCNVKFDMVYNDGVNFMFGVCPVGYSESAYINTTNPEHFQKNYAELITSAQYPPIPWTEDSFTKWETQYGSQFTLGVIGKNVAGVGGLITSAAKGNYVDIISGVTNIANGIMQDVGTYQSKEKAYDDVNGSIGSSYFNIQYDKFLTFYHKGITTDNARCIDDFFTAFGYAVKKYKTPYVADLSISVNTVEFDSLPDKRYGLRERFNYVKCNDVNIDSVSGKYINAKDIEKIEQIFTNGVTFWSVYQTIPVLDIESKYYTKDYNNYKVDNTISYTEEI